MLHTWLPCIPADLVPDHWRNPGNCSRAGQHARSLRCGSVSSNVLARVHPWVSFEKSWLSFRLSRTPWLRSIVDFETRLNYASQILIMCHCVPRRILIYASPFKLFFGQRIIRSTTVSTRRQSPLSYLAPV